jgi:hypothetical protein
MRCEVIIRERPGTGPAAVPSSTSLVPLASFSAVYVCCGVQLGPGCLRNTLFSRSRDDRGRRQTGQQAARESPDGLDVSVTISLPDVPALAVGSYDFV